MDLSIHLCLCNDYYTFTSIYFCCSVSQLKNNPFLLHLLHYLCYLYYCCTISEVKVLSECVEGKVSGVL